MDVKMFEIIVNRTLSEFLDLILRVHSPDSLDSLYSTRIWVMGLPRLGVLFFGHIGVC
jgi:hypothetical protein